MGCMCEAVDEDAIIETFLGSHAYGTLYDDSNIEDIYGADWTLMHVDDSCADFREPISMPAVLHHTHVNDSSADIREPISMHTLHFLEDIYGADWTRMYANDSCAGLREPISMPAVPLPSPANNSSADFREPISMHTSCLFLGVRVDDSSAGLREPMSMHTSIHSYADFGFYALCQDEMVHVLIRAPEMVPMTVKGNKKHLSFGNGIT